MWQMDFIARAVIDRPFRRLGRAALLDRLHAVRALADGRGVRYLDEAGHVRLIDIALKPWLLTRVQLRAFHHVAMQLASALLRLVELRAAVPAIRQIIPLEPERERWLELATHPTARPLAVMGRLDSTATYDHAQWHRAFRMLEPNAVGVGGVFYAPTACSILWDVVGDLLQKALPGRRLTPTPDPRQLLVAELQAVARRIRTPLRGVALIENTDFTTGTDEFRSLAAYLSDHGINAVVADPRQLRLARGELIAGRTRVDLLYRDSELAEFVEMERGGHRLTALRQAVRQGRLISGLTWELDQKSAWEVFTDAAYTKYFTASQQRLFAEHVLWTRLVREATVTDATGRSVDLVPFIRRNRRQLVLKPNTLCGGEGVVIGQTVSQREWEAHLATALRGRERCVVQQLATIQQETFPRLERGGVVWSSRCVVSGFFFTSSGIGLIGRFSGAPVVNVSRGGGLLPAFLVD